MRGSTFIDRSSTRIQTFSWTMNVLLLSLFLLIGGVDSHLTVSDIELVKSKCEEHGIKPEQIFATLRYYFHHQEAIKAHSENPKCLDLTKAVLKDYKALILSTDACALNSFLTKKLCAPAYKECPSDKKIVIVSSFLEMYRKQECDKSDVLQLQGSYRNPSVFFDKATSEFADMYKGTDCIAEDKAVSPAAAHFGCAVLLIALGLHLIL